MTGRWLDRLAQPARLGRPGSPPPGGSAREAAGAGAAPASTPTGVGGPRPKPWALFAARPSPAGPEASAGAPTSRRAHAGDAGTTGGEGGRGSGVRAPGALLLLALCFAGSAVLRIADPDGAVAKEAAATVAGAGDHAAAADACDAEADPSGLLAALKQRENQLDSRAAGIADRERLLQVAEAKYREQLEALRTAEERLAATLAVADEAAEKDIERLTAVYENMNPKNAAKIFESMDVTFAAGFLARMRKDTAAKIMGGMSAERAYAISAVIAGRNARAPRE